MNNNPAGKRVTLQDIAEKTGFTINTVSRALKDKPDISRATCEHIQQVAREMGYVRNVMASAMRSGRTKTLGVVLGGMSNPYYSIMADEIQDVAMSLGYSLMILCSRDDPDLEYHMVETAISRSVDGILLFPCFGSQRTIQRMRDAGMPFVLMSRYLVRDEADAVVADEAHGAYLATMHMIERGCRHLAFLSSYNVVYSSEQRRQGFLRACEEKGIPEAHRHIAVCRENALIISQLRRWREEGMDGLFCFCDMEAWNAQALLEIDGLDVEGLSIVGFDNLQRKLHFPSPMCSVDCCIPELVRSAVDLLRRRIHGEDSPPQTIVFPARLVCRSSCGGA